MQDDQNGNRVCTRCSNVEDTAPIKREQLSLLADPHVGHKTIFNLLYSIIIKDAKPCGVPLDKASARMMPAWENIQQYALIDGQWQDLYCDGTRRVTSSSSKDPFKASIDAVFPYILVDGW